MSYTEDAVLAKFSALNESHDSIATAAQWILFHRRHAEKTVHLWMQRLKDASSTKRLTLIYLANEVAQQSKARHKDDFVLAFGPIIPEATAIAYKGAPTELQQKIRRVVDVWKDRAVFEAPIQAAIESRIEDLDKLRGGPTSGFGASPFTSSSVPSELSPLVGGLQKTSKLEPSVKSSVALATQEYDKLTDSSVPVPSAPVYAARLNGLLKTLATAEGSVSESVEARKSIVATLEQLLSSHRASLAEEEGHLSQVSGRKAEIESKKQDVELAIMKGLGPSDIERSPVEGSSASPAPEIDRPEVEALTPPPALEEPPISPITPPPATAAPDPDPEATGMDVLSQAAAQQTYQSVGTNWPNKRRRLDDDGFPDLGGDDDIDADVAEMLRKENAVK